MGHYGLQLKLCNINIPNRIQTYNNFLEGSDDIHFTIGTTYLPGLTWRVVGRRLLRKPLATIFHLLDHVQATIGFDKEILPHIRRVRNVDIHNHCFNTSSLR